MKYFMSICTRIKFSQINFFSVYALVLLCTIIRRIKLYKKNYVIPLKKNKNHLEILRAHLERICDHQKMSLSKQSIDCSTMCFLFFCFCFLSLAFSSFVLSIVLSIIVFLATYFLFLLFINFYLGRHKTKNRIKSKIIRNK